MSTQIIEMKETETDGKKEAKRHRRRSRGLTIEETLHEQRHENICGLSMHKNSYRLLTSIVSFVLILSIGGAIFHALEQPSEHQRVELSKKTHAEVERKLLALLGGNRTLWKQLRNVGAKIDPPLIAENWDYGSSCMFAFTVLTTIGYGTFAPTTDGGRAFLVIYAIVAIPTAGLTFVFLADRALFQATRCVTRNSDKITRAFDSLDSDHSGFLDLDEFRSALGILKIELTERQFLELINKIDANGDETIDREEFALSVEELSVDLTEIAGRGKRITVVLVSMCLWVSIGTLIFCYSENWSFGVGLYFSFVTLTTVGLGDYYPASVGGQFFLVLFALVGLGLLASLLTLVERFFQDAQKAKQIALEKARSAAVSAKRIRGSFSGHVKGRLNINSNKNEKDNERKNMNNTNAVSSSKIDMQMTKSITERNKRLSKVIKARRNSSTSRID
jgi:hypothetical protein